MKIKNVGAGICALIGLAGMVAGGMILKRNTSQENSDITEQDILEIDEMFEEMD